MKILNAFIYLVVISMFAACSEGKPNGSGSNSDELSGKITMSGAFAMYPMVVAWSEEFKKIHPQVQFDIQAGGSGKGMTDVLSGTVDFGMVSREIRPEEETKGAYLIGVTIDAVIPTFSAENPYSNEIYNQGVSKQQFNDIFLTEKIKTWGDLLENGSTEKIEVFTRSDACGAGETFAKYMGEAKQEDLKGIGIFGDPGLAAAVIQSKFSIGYNNVNFSYDAGTRKTNTGLAVIPLDINSNGALDSNENIYGTLDQLNQAIVEGIFPSPPSRLLFLVHKGQPTDPLQIAFLKWILSDGQKLCGATGYIALSEEKLQEQLKRIPQEDLK